MGKRTPGPWREGTSHGAIVADTPVPGFGGSDAVDYYGGHLVAETVAPQNRPLIIAAPEMDAIIGEAIELIEGDLTGVKWKQACHAFIRKAKALRKATGADQ